MAFNDFYRTYLDLLNRTFNGERELMLEAVPQMFELKNRMIQQANGMEFLQLQYS